MHKRLEKKPYFNEISSRPTVLWFRAKRYGWGWIPVTWQGWAVTLMYVFWIFSEVHFVNGHTHSVSDFLIKFIPAIYIVTVFFIIICYATGEKPGWRWGSRWTEKYFDILDERGEKTGQTALRTVVHDQGLWHRAVHVYMVNSKNEVLLQCRSAKNSFRPGRWYLSFGGHIEAGETSIQAAERLAHDELGLELADNEFIYAGTIKKQNVLLYGTYLNNEFDDIYVVRKDVPHPTITKPLQDEIVKVQWFPVEEYKNYIHGNDPDFVQYEGLNVFFEWFDKHAHKN